MNDNYCQKHSHLQSFKNVCINEAVKFHLNLNKCLNNHRFFGLVFFCLLIFAFLFVSVNMPPESIKKVFFC